MRAARRIWASTHSDGRGLLSEPEGSSEFVLETGLPVSRRCGLFERGFLNASPDSKAGEK